MTVRGNSGRSKLGVPLKGPGEYSVTINGTASPIQALCLSRLARTGSAPCKPPTTNAYRNTNRNGRAAPMALLPMNRRLAVGRRQHVSLGVEPSWLAGVRTRVQESSIEDGVVTSGPSESTWGYPQGYQRWDVALQAGYHYYLGQGLRIGTVASYGLRDLTDNSYFTRGLNDRQLNWRIWLDYDLRTFGNR